MAVTISARCHPDLDGVVPPPVAASGALPAWLRDMPPEAVSEMLGGINVRTFKQCPPLIDACSIGIMLRLACDLEVRDGELSWDWDMPVLPGHSASRAPIGIHAPEQATGAPFQPTGLFVKFTNYWTLSVPEGWQLLFTHPFNRLDLPFQALTGLVDCDRFGDGYVHCPARWLDPDWEGVLEAGTPFAQVIALPREAVVLQAVPMTAQNMAATEEIQQSIAAEEGVYRKRFRLRARA